jgi:hypothetical protein
MTGTVKTTEGTMKQEEKPQDDRTVHGTTAEAQGQNEAF